MKFFLLTKNVYYDRIINRYTVNIKDGRHSGIGGQMAEKATNMTGTPFPDKETEFTISDMTDEQLVSRITQTGGEKIRNRTYKAVYTRYFGKIRKDVTALPVCR